MKVLNKRWLLVSGLLLVGIISPTVQRGDTPPKKRSGVTTSTAVGPSAPLKPAWQFTNDERFALRTNPALARQRLAESRQSPSAKVRAASADTHPWIDSFDGRTHPELFLPHEVFRHLIALAFASDAQMREIVRHGMAPDVRKASLPLDFWERLEAITAFHVADVRAESDLLASRSKASGAARERIEKALALKRTDLCRSRAGALAAARSAFGRERFDRFLYEAIAIHMFHSSDRLPTTAELRQWEDGCR